MHKRMNDDRMGYSIDLPNGLTVSVQWHEMAYANVVDDDVISVEIACWMTDSSPSFPNVTQGFMNKDIMIAAGFGDAVARWMTRKVWVHLPHSTEGDFNVIGWVPVSDVAKYIDIAKKW